MTTANSMLNADLVVNNVHYQKTGLQRTSSRAVTENCYDIL
jgi:hypothetical protein